MQAPILFSLLAALILGAILSKRFSKWLYQTRINRRFARAKKKEEEAQQLLEASGFVVLGTQIPGSISVRHNHKLLTSRLRADYLARKSGKLYIVEVKSGNYATHVLEPHTRRQLLEYALAYPVDGLLLVNMETEQIAEVVFPALQRQKMPFSAKLSLWLFGVVCGLLFAYWLEKQHVFQSITVPTRHDASIFAK